MISFAAKMESMNELIGNSGVLVDIRKIIEQGRRQIYAAANKGIVLTYWHIEELLRRNNKVRNVHEMIKIGKGGQRLVESYRLSFADPEGKLRVELIFDGDTVWTTQKRIAEIFQVDVRTVSYHINEILESGELNRYSVVQKNWITESLE